MFANQVGEVLDINFFELKYLRLFVQEIYDFKIEFKTYPTKQTLESIFNTKYKDEIEPSIKQLKDFFCRCTSGENNNINKDYVKSKALEFCKKQKLKEAMIKSVDLLKKSSYEEIKKLIDDALKLGTNYDVRMFLCRSF